MIIIILNGMSHCSQQELAAGLQALKIEGVDHSGQTTAPPPTSPQVAQLQHDAGFAKEHHEVNYAAAASQGRDLRHVGWRIS